MRRHALSAVRGSAWLGLVAVLALVLPPLPHAHDHALRGAVDAAGAAAPGTPSDCDGAHGGAERFVASHAGHVHTPGGVELFPAAVERAHPCLACAVGPAPPAFQPARIDIGRVVGLDTSATTAARVVRSVARLVPVARGPPAA